MAISPPTFRVSPVSGSLLRGIRGPDRPNVFQDFIGTAMRLGMQNQFAQQRAEQQHELLSERQRTSDERRQENAIERAVMTGDIQPATPENRGILQEQGIDIRPIKRGDQEYFPGSTVRKAREQHRLEERRNEPTVIRNERTGDYFTREELSEVQQSGRQADFQEGQFDSLINEARQIGPDIERQVRQLRQQSLEDDNFISASEQAEAESVVNRAVDIKLANSRIAQTNQQAQRDLFRASSSLHGAEIIDSETGERRPITGNERLEQVALLTRPRSLREQVGEQEFNRISQDAGRLRFKPVDYSDAYERFRKGAKDLTDIQTHRITVNQARAEVKNSDDPMVQQWFEKTWPEGAREEAWQNWWQRPSSRTFREAFYLTDQEGISTYDAYLEFKRLGQVPPMPPGVLMMANVTEPGFGYDPENDPRVDLSNLQGGDQISFSDAFYGRDNATGQGPTLPEQQAARRKFGEVAATVRDGLTGTLMSRFRASADPTQTANEIAERYSRMRTQPTSVVSEFRQSAQSIQDRIDNGEFNQEFVPAQRRRAEIYTRLAEIISTHPDLASLAVEQIFIPSLREARQLSGAGGQGPTAEQDSILRNLNRVGGD